MFISSISIPTPHSKRGHLFCIVGYSSLVANSFTLSITNSSIGIRYQSLLCNLSPVFKDIKYYPFISLDSLDKMTETVLLFVLFSVPVCI